MMNKQLLAALCLLLGACASAAREEASVPPVDDGPLVVQDMRGNELDLDATIASGKTVALVFWQTWCKSCIAEAPKLASAAATYSREVQFIGVVPGTNDAVDDAEVTRVAAQLGLTYPQVRDRDLRLTERFAIEGTPTIIALGAGGEEVFRGHRPPKSWRKLAAQ